MVTSIVSTKAVVRFSFKDPIHILEKSKKKDSLIFLHLAFNNERLKYSTGYKSSFDNWDFNKQRIKESKAGILNALEVNTFLNLLESTLKREHARLIGEGIKPTKSDIIKILDQASNRNSIDVVKPKTFFEYAQNLVEHKTGTISEITKRSYNQTILKLRLYQEVYKEQLTFESFDKIFHGKFVSMLQDHDFSLNTIGKHVKNLKVFLNSAVEDGVSTNLKFKGKDFKSKTEETTAIYLSLDELNSMHQLDLSHKKHLELARDIFLIGCYIGQRISDYNGLKANSIKTIRGVKFIQIVQKKTKTNVSVPLSKEALEILDLRYDGLPPPKMPSQNLNDYIKEVGKLLNLNELVECKRTKGGIQVLDNVPKYSLLHSHTARRSFCTNMYKEEMPVIDIMFFSGHKTEREFYKYIRIKGEERAVHIANLGFFNLGKESKRVKL